jgi:hypothetical protein
VLQTLIRAYFSPLATTGQRYIYSGSADGSVYIWGDNFTSILLPHNPSHTPTSPYTSIRDPE